MSMPKRWTRGTIVKLPNKGDLSNCNNWGGITLLPIPGKAFCSVLLERIKKEIDKKLREHQAGFRSGRSCIEQIYTLRHIIQQSLEFQQDIYINFIDFKKAFDSIHRDSLWKISRSYGIPDKYINLFKLIYENSSCNIRTQTGVTDSFNIVTGVRQGCILSPFLFLLVIDFVMRKTFEDKEWGINMSHGNLSDLDFADDIALLANKLQQLQEMTSSLEENAAKVGLQISSEKTSLDDNNYR